MPKSPTNTPVPEIATAERKDEAKMIDVIKGDDKLYQHLTSVFAKGRKRQSCIVEDITAQHHCTASTLKKAFAKVRQHREAKRALDKEGSVERRDTRRSRALHSATDETISAAASTVDSTDNSCASSVCGSPKLQPRQASCKNLSTINEQDVSLGSIASASSTVAEVESTQQRKPRPRQKRAAPETEEEEEEKQQPEEETEGEEATAEDNVSDSSDRRQCQAHPDSTAVVLDDADQTNKLRKFLEMTLPADDKLRALTLETPRNTLQPNNSVSGSSRRGSVARQCRDVGVASKLLPEPEDCCSTRLFFDSIGLTVQNFPQHVQAAVKAQVSRMVHELEFKLSSPDGDDTLAAMSA